MARENKAKARAAKDKAKAAAKAFLKDGRISDKLIGQPRKSRSAT